MKLNQDAENPHGLIPSLSGESWVESLVFSLCCVGPSSHCLGARMLGPDGNEIGLSQFVQPWAT